MRRRIAAPLLAAAFALLGASAAEAATLNVAGGKSCYRLGDSLILSGSGYTPSAPVAITLQGQQLGTLTADAAGNISSSLQIRNLRGVSRRTLVATDSANPANTASARFLGSALVVTVRPRNGSAARRLRLKASGFTTGKHLYAHVLRKGFRRTVLIGRLKGPCRTLSVRKRVLAPGTATGVYTVQFDTKKRYSKKTKVRYRFRVTVT